METVTCRADAARRSTTCYTHDMSNATLQTERVLITERHIGRIWIDRYTYGHTLGLRSGLHRLDKPVEAITQYVITGVQPADAHYTQTQPNAGPRVEVELARLRPNGTFSPAGRRTRRWLATTGNEKTTEELVVVDLPVNSNEAFDVSNAFRCDPTPVARITATHSLIRWIEEGGLLAEGWKPSDVEARLAFSRSLISALVTA